MKSLGPIFLENNLEKLTNSLNLLITKEAKCLAPVDDDDEEEQETDAKVWDPIADILPKMAKTLRESYKPVFMKLLNGLFEYSNPDRDIYDNQCLVGLLADSFKYVPDLANPIMDKLMSWLLKTQSQEDEGLMRNVVYCFGVLVSKNTEAMAPYFP